MSESLYLAIDQGGHASRALVFTHAGELVAKAFAEIGTQHPAPDRVEHDPREMVQSIQTALEQVTRQLGDDCARLRAAGLATQRSSIVCWDRESGEPLSPVISWQDRRAADWLVPFSQHEPQIHTQTGLRLSPHYGVSKLNWCLENLPSVAMALDQGRLAWGPLASFLLNQLLEERPLLVDPANASRTLLWDLKSAAWSPELLSLFSLPRAPLPQCVPSRYSYGTLRLGDYRLPLTVTTGDQSAALFAYGRPQADTLYINMGTGAFVQQPCGNHAPDPSRLLASLVYQDEQGPLYVMEGTVNGAGSALEWARGQLGIPAEELPSLLEEGFNYCQEPPLFLNGISGLGSPYWQADFPSQFVGEGENICKLAGVGESVLFLLNTNIQYLAERPETTFNRILISGGLAQQDELCQRLADLTQLPVQRPDSTEATARGLIFLLADQPQAWQAFKYVKTFAPQDDPAVNKRYRRWQAAMAQVPRVS